MIPTGYEARTSGATQSLVVTAAGNWLQDVLDSGRTVHAWAREQIGAEALRGRGPVYSVRAPVPGPDGHARWAVRHYRRGGAMATLLGDRYLRSGPTRPDLETRVSVEARARGVPTPAVVAGIWYPAGPIYRADLVTELLPDATSLADVLFSGSPDEEAIPALTAAGQLIRECGGLGLRHADVNAMNVVFAPEGTVRRAYLIDLDRAEISDDRTAGFGAPMLARLERSLAKLARASGRQVSQPEVTALRAGYEGGS